MNTYKRAALCLHGLHETDRSWLLARLSDDQRSQLGTMLQELEKLGIPKERSWVPEVPVAENRASSHQAPLPLSPIRQLDQAEPSVVKRMLQDEPAPFVAAFLGLHDWSWQRGLTAGRKKSNAQGLPAPDNDVRRRTTAKTRDTLFELLVERLQECAATDSSLAMRQDAKPKGQRRFRWKP
jgi:hypothetical protein